MPRPGWDPRAGLCSFAAPSHLVAASTGLDYAAINATILAILFAAFVGYLLVVFESTDRLTTELLNTADQINDEEHIWNVQTSRRDPEFEFSFTGRSASDLVDVFEALAIGAEHADLPAPS